MSALKEAPREAQGLAFQQRQPVPQRKVRLMPPVHFQVELAFPGVVGQAGFRRRIVPGVLDGGEVLRQHDAPLSSNQRGSRLPDKSIAPPVLQNRFQCFCAAPFACAYAGKFLAVRFVGEKAQTNSSVSEGAPSTGSA